MGTDINSLITAAISSTFKNTAVPAAPAGATALESIVSDPYNEQQSKTFTFGTGTDKAKGHFHGKFTVNAGAQTVFDMAGALTDVFGTAIAATEVKAILIVNLNAVVGDKLEVFGDAAGGGNSMPIVKAAGDALVIGPGGFLLLSNPIDGYAVGAGATDDIEISNPGGNNIDFEIWILYEHA